MTKPVKSQKVVIGDQECEYVVRKSRRARHLLLHVDISGAISLVLPYRVSYEQGDAFVKSKKRWIAEQLEAQAARARQIPRYLFVSGEAFFCFGEMFQLNVTKAVGSRTTLKQTGTMLTIKGGNPRRAIERWYKKQAQTFFEREVELFAASIGISDVEVRINNAHSQWGSCNPKKRKISFTWRLALAPQSVARYVVAHEVAHLRYGGHGKRFWQLVNKLNPGYQRQQQYLKESGHSLTL